MSEKSSTYCHYPFHELALKKFYKGHAVTFWPCCMMGNSLPDDPEFALNRLGVEKPWELTPEEMFDHPRMELLRSRMLNGERDPACKVCWNQEDAGIKSYRQFSDSPYHSKNDVSLDVIDLTLSNICNLRCRMCDPRSSNLLMTDYKYFEENNLLDRVTQATNRWGPSNTSAGEKSKQIEWLINNPDKIKVIKASGGETFYDKTIIDILKTYVKTGAASNIGLEFVTNGTLFDSELIELLNHFKENNHTISIDGTGKVYNYIRHMSDFDLVSKSVKLYIDNIQNHKRFQFAFVVSAHNVLNAGDFIEWVQGMTDKFNIVFSPINPNDRGISLHHMPVSLLSLSKERLVKFPAHITSNLVAQIDNAIVDNKENKSAILEETVLFDMSRDQSFKDYLDPELVEYLS